MCLGFTGLRIDRLENVSPYCKNSGLFNLGNTTVLFKLTTTTTKIENNQAKINKN